MATQADRIAALEAQTLALEAALEAAPKLIEAALRMALSAELQPLAAEVVRAHSRIDHAGSVFKDLRSALRPKTEPQATRLPRAEFDRALDDLRAQAAEEGRTQRFFPTPAILERAMNLRRLAEQTAAAGA